MEIIGFVVCLVVGSMIVATCLAWFMFHKPLLLSSDRVEASDLGWGKRFFMLWSGWTALLTWTLPAINFCFYDTGDGKNLLVFSFSCFFGFFGFICFGLVWSLIFFKSKKKISDIKYKYKYK